MLLLLLLFVTPGPDVFVGSMHSTLNKQGRAESHYLLHFSEIFIVFQFLLLLSHHQRQCFEEQSVAGHHSYLILTALKVSSIYHPFKAFWASSALLKMTNMQELGPEWRLASTAGFRICVFPTSANSKSTLLLLTLTIHFLHWMPALRAGRMFFPPTLHCICQKSSLAHDLFSTKFPPALILKVQIFCVRAFQNSAVHICPHIWLCTHICNFCLGALCALYQAIGIGPVMLLFCLQTA